MKTNKDIAILMYDNCTRKEAEQYLKNGTLIYDNPSEWIDSLKDCNCYEGETIEEARQYKYENISVIEYQGHEYLIEYTC